MTIRERERAKKVFGVLQKQKIRMVMLYGWKRTKYQKWFQTWMTNWKNKNEMLWPNE